MSTYAITEARNQLGALAREASTSREPIYLTDHGHQIAAIVHPDAIRDLEEQLAHERYLRQRAEGTVSPGVPNDEARRMVLERIEAQRASGESGA
jgi:PHD/YefM family antitoxin component YafN of YafNO toxin-antitoxin module